MHKLELKLPPVLLVILFALAMRVLSALEPAGPTGDMARLIALLLALAGGLICGLGVLQFRRARTTVNPLQPGEASALVTEGLYRLSRNPMYLGFLLLLLAWALFLASRYALALLPLFVWYMNRFQIVPEERVLGERFGAAFAAYQARVRRWI